MDNYYTNPETEAMGTIVTAIDNLDKDAQGRVIRWLMGHYAGMENDD